MFEQNSKNFKAEIVNGKELANKILKNLKIRIKQFKQGKKSNKFNIYFLEKQIRSPKIGVILCGSNPASMSYVRKKVKYGRKIGIESEIYHFDDNI